MSDEKLVYGVVGTHTSLKLTDFLGRGC